MTILAAEHSPTLGAITLSSDLRLYSNGQVLISESTPKWIEVHPKLGVVLPFLDSCKFTSPLARMFLGTTGVSGIMGLMNLYLSGEIAHADVVKTLYAGAESHKKYLNGGDTSVGWADSEVCIVTNVSDRGVSFWPYSAYFTLEEWMLFGCSENFIADQIEFPHCVGISGASTVKTLMQADMSFERACALASRNFLGLPGPEKIYQLSFDLISDNN